MLNRATQADIESLAELFDQYRQFYEQPADLDACRQYIAERLGAEESVIFIARDDDGKALGFTQLYLSFCSVEMCRLVYLYDLFVIPQARRKGVARALMEAAKQFGEDIGAGRLQLETAHTNLAGQALYESLGWERDEEFYTYHLPVNG